MTPVIFHMTPLKEGGTSEAGTTTQMQRPFWCLLIVGEVMAIDTLSSKEPHNVWLIGLA